MFEDLDKNNAIGKVPAGNVPVPETAPAPAGPPPSGAEDIFANVEPPQNDLAQKPPVFQPKQELSESRLIQENYPDSPKTQPIQKLVMGGIVGGIIILFFLALWYGYYIFLPKLEERKQPAAGIADETNLTDDIAETDTAGQADEPAAGNELVATATPQISGTEIPATSTGAVIDPAIPQASTTAEREIPDSDGDGLPDDEEKILGTDPGKTDTDDDSLFDREEVKVYRTDPLDPDSDKDGYSDGEEVKNNYNPAGPGKLYEIK